MEEVIGMVVIGFFLLAAFNLVLEIIGISFFSSERISNLLARLVLIVALSAGIGYGAVNYLDLRSDLEFNQISTDEFTLDDYDDEYQEDSGPMCQPDYYWESCEGSGCTKPFMCRNGCSGEWADDRKCGAYPDSSE